MNDNERQKRRHKRIQKQREKREPKSRAGRSPNDVARDPSRGLLWPVDEVWVSQTWDVPASRVDVVLSRCDEVGNAVVARFTIDRSGPGVLAAQAIGGLRREHISAQAGDLGEASGVALVETTAKLAVALVRDAEKHGKNPLPTGWEQANQLLYGLEVGSLEVPFGPAVETEKKTGGLIGRIAGWFLG